MNVILSLNRIIKPIMNQFYIEKKFTTLEIF